FFFSSRRRHTRFSRDWSSDVCSSDLFVLPGIDLSDAKLNVTVSRHSQTSIANGTSIDLNNPVPLTVTGIDGRTHTYTLRAMEPQDRKSVVQGKSGEREPRGSMRRKKE